MKRFICLHTAGAIAAAFLLITLSATSPAHAQAATHARPHRHASKIQIPEAMRLEHLEIHAALVSATKLPGQVGEAARKLAAVLDPHFMREEQIALPPLGLLAPLSRGEYTAEMREVLPMTDALRAELPRMLSEHKAIRKATVRLGKVAKAAGNAWVERLAETLKVHAQSEEEVSYPAALLVGDLVR
ncbi:MAG TPA: hemerythrin domain-containing protein, partial [Chthoniobacteraceae bacterium]|nr:hemerythrin domain-containing protein [Chthoniobacteraceae bacterium]